MSPFSRTNRKVAKNEDIPLLARERVAALYTFKNHEDTSTPDDTFTSEDFYVVWFCKTLQNWKALVSTDLEDGIYVEVTYNGDKNETYLDVYEKRENVEISVVPASAYITPDHLLPQPISDARDYPWAEQNKE